MEDICPIQELVEFRADNVNFTKGLKYRSFDCWVNKELFYKIKIFKTKENMRDYVDDDDFDAMCLTYDTYENDETKEVIFKDRNGNTYEDRLGELLFSEENLGGGTVSHEVVHCILDWCRIGYDDFFDKLKEEDEGYEELFAYLVGDCVKHIFNVLYDYKIIGE